MMQEQSKVLYINLLLVLYSLTSPALTTELLELTSSIPSIQ